MNKVYTAITAAIFYALTAFYTPNAAMPKTQTAQPAPKKQHNTAQHTTMHTENPTTIKIKGLGQGLVYLIDPKYSEIEASVSRKTNAFGYFIDKAESEHNGTLEAIVTGAFFDPITGKSIGLIVSNHKLITSGTSKYGTNFIYDHGNICMVDNYENNWTQYQTVIGGLARLVRHGNIAIDSTLKRNINPYSAIGRCAIGITNKGKMAIVFYTGSVPDLAKYMMKIGCREAAQLDSGSSRAFYIKGTYLKKNGKEKPGSRGILLKRDNPERRVKAVIEVMKRKIHRREKK